MTEQTKLATIVDERNFLEFLETAERRPVPFWPTTPAQDAHYEAVALQRGQLVIERLIGRTIIEIKGDELEWDDETPMLWSNSGYVLVLDDGTDITIDEPNMRVIGLARGRLESIIGQKIVAVRSGTPKWYVGAKGIQTGHELIFRLDNGGALEMAEPWMHVSGPSADGLPTAGEDSVSS